MDLEHELTQLLGASADSLTPPIHAIVAEADRRGRRFRRRRRLQVAGSTVAVTALAVTGAVFGLHPENAGPAVIAPAASVAAPISTPTRAPASAPASPSVSAAGSEQARPLSSEAMLKIFADALPAGARLTNFARTAPTGWADPGADSFSVEYDDGHGPATVGVALGRTNQPLPACSWLSPDPQGQAGAEGVSCWTDQAASGRMVTAIGNLRPTGCFKKEVYLSRNDGMSVHVTLENCAVRDNGALQLFPRTDTPLTTGFWQQLAELPAWRHTVPESVLTAGTEYAQTVSKATW